MNRTLALPALGIIVVASLTGCATKTYVRDQVSASEGRTGSRLAEVVSTVEAHQGQIAELQSADAQQKQRLDELSATARDALTRAEEAGKLAKGSFVDEVVLSDDAAHFDFESAELSDAAKEALDAFARKLKENNANVYIEIQGHTDSSGPAAYNLVLGRQRAEAVRRYLHTADGVALHRMSVFSYGAEQPIADNSTREGRAKNRRVTLVVLS